MARWTKHVGLEALAQICLVSLMCCYCAAHTTYIFQWKNVLGFRPDIFTSTYNLTVVTFSGAIRSQGVIVIFLGEKSISKSKSDCITTSLATKSSNQDHTWMIYIYTWAIIHFRCSSLIYAPIALMSKITQQIFNSQQTGELLLNIIQ
jgi:hypothetical protein